MKDSKISMGLLVLILTIGVTSVIVSGCFGFFTSKSWKEEVKLNDGRVIVVKRELIREGGGGEWASNRSLSKPKEYEVGRQ